MNRKEELAAGALLEFFVGEVLRNRDQSFVCAFCVDRMEKDNMMDLPGLFSSDSEGKFDWRLFFAAFSLVEFSAGLAGAESWEAAERGGGVPYTPYLLGAFARVLFFIGHAVTCSEFQFSARIPDVGLTRIGEVIPEHGKDAFAALQTELAALGFSSAPREKGDV